MSHYDVVVIGAGPAGLSCGATLAEMGLDTLVLDEQIHLGGQIYRNVESTSAAQLEFFGEDYAQGRAIVQRFRKSNAKYQGGAMVWQVEGDGTVCYSCDGVSKQISSNYVVIATGAMERPVPLKGWTLPGVLGAGAANNLAKEAGLSPNGKVVLCGSGPLLLLEASLLIKKGVQIEAILDTTPLIPSFSTIKHLPRALLRTDFLLKGLKILWDINKSKVRYLRGVSDLKMLGQDKVEQVECTHKGEKVTIPTDVALLHFGVIPNTHVMRQVGCEMRWDTELRYWHPVCDQWGRTNHDRVFVAGDGGYVSGAVAAGLKGDLAGLEIAHSLGILSASTRDEMAKPISAKITKDKHPRPFIDAMYAPRAGQYGFENETVVCRCENVTVGEIREVISQGAHDPNEIKIITRAGMGPCQGRMCGAAINELLAEELESTPDEVGYLTIRPPLKGVPLSEIAAMSFSEASGPADLFKNQK
ncbi:NAD(P)/FAD-dependent oxidoreductase [Halodesulfovibrio marinisediminis]|uniref:Thioredoxin reductase n=1 Tax=Halodesulfovibrio marinisediminis DSM 17456 TaxID=1121457 RepID=A0A1N6GT41_9BACT|nr:NAD(P)/FAD-dependent oxidoreductase [Halodesulfovibrio marinisediminis]SIO10668.1 Thioredoxin reductase [Halodesulfovibrio marinisediminis DSM 17456]